MSGARPRHLVAAAILAGCAAERVIVEDPAGVVTSCDEVWRMGSSGAPCAFVGGCERPLPYQPECCTDYAYCGDDGLVMDTVCDEGCGCGIDFDCPYGEAVCESPTCVPCPRTELCGECPPGFVPLVRNGCATCTCAPPPECEAAYAYYPYDCADPGEMCYAGSVCADGCDPFTAGCCANTCSAAGCAGPAPLGCFTPCVDGTGDGCATVACECVQGSWSCESAPAPGLATTCVWP